ncbi:hypothetical protein ACFOGQ_14895 [Acinetobacter vivianii]
MQKLSCKQLATDPLPLWKQLVNERITELKSIQKVADEIGYARPSLSLALRDKYIGSTEKLEKKVYKCLGKLIAHSLKSRLVQPNAECLRQEMHQHRTLPRCAIGELARDVK